MSGSRQSCHISVKHCLQLAEQKPLETSFWRKSTHAQFNFLVVVSSCGWYKCRVVQNDEVIHRKFRKINLRRKTAVRHVELQLDRLPVPSAGPVRSPEPSKTPNGSRRAMARVWLGPPSRRLHRAKRCGSHRSHEWTTQQRLFLDTDASE